MAPFRTLALVPLACMLLVLPLASALPASGDAVAHADAADDLDWGMGGLRNLLGKRKPRCGGKGQKCCEDESKAPCTAPLTSCSEKTKRCLPCGLLNRLPCDDGECYLKLVVDGETGKCAVAPPAECDVHDCPLPEDDQCMERVCIHHYEAGSHCGFKAIHVGESCMAEVNPLTRTLLEQQIVTVPGVCSEGTCEPCGAQGGMCCPAGAPGNQYDTDSLGPFVTENCEPGQECLGKSLKKTCKPCGGEGQQQCDDLDDDREIVCGEFLIDYSLLGNFEFLGDMQLTGFTDKEGALASAAICRDKCLATPRCDTFGVFPSGTCRRAVVSSDAPSQGQSVQFAGFVVYRVCPDMVLQEATEKAVAGQPQARVAKVFGPLVPE